MSSLQGPAIVLAKELKGFIESDLLFDRPEVVFSEDTDLFGAGLIDSLGLMRLVANLEDTYRIEIADEELVPEIFGTIARLAAFVERKRRQG